MKRKGFKILHIRNIAGSNPALRTNYKGIQCQQKLITKNQPNLLLNKELKFVDNANIMQHYFAKNVGVSCP